MRLGTSPGMSRISPPGLGTLASSRRVYGCAARAKNTSAGAASISWPAYITTTRSQISCAVPLARVAAERRPRVTAVVRARRLPLHQVHDLCADGEHRAERRVGILRDEGDRAPAHAVVDHGGVLAQQVGALEAHLAAADSR